MPEYTIKIRCYDHDVNMAGEVIYAASAQVFDESGEAIPLNDPRLQHFGLLEVLETAASSFRRHGIQPGSPALHKMG